MDALSEDLVKDKVANDRPVWKMRGGERWLYLTTAAGPSSRGPRGPGFSLVIHSPVVLGGFYMILPTKMVVVVGI